MTSAEKLYPQVKHVVEAEEPVAVAVTDGDVQTANRKDPASCALVRAFMREYDVDGVVVTLSTAYVVKGDIAYRYQVPSPAAKQAVKFDRGGDFQLGEYELKPFPSSQLLRNAHSTRPAMKRTTPPNTTRNKKHGVRQIPTVK